MSKVATTTSSSSGNSKPILVFVHGMYESNLVDTATGKQVWLSPMTVLESLLWKKDHSVKAPLSWSTDGMRQNKDTLKADSIMAQTCKPWLNFLQTLERNNQARVLRYVWDWRRSLEETCERFLKWIHQQQGLSSQHRAVLVTFSTGSLIGWAAVNQFPELFERWVSVGGAVGGGNRMLHEFVHGWKLGPVQLLTAETYCSMPSLFSFFPMVGEPGSMGLFTDEKTQQDVAFDILDPKVWKEQEFGIYELAKRQGRSVTEQEQTHLFNCLEAARRFRKKYFYRDGATSFDDERFLFHSKDKYSHLDIVCYGSRACDTTHKGWWYNSSEGRVKLQEPILGSGDGTVMEWAWKLVPGGLSFKTVFADATHTHLLADKKFISFMGELLEIQSSRAQHQSPDLPLPLSVGLVLVALAIVFSFSSTTIQIA